MEKAIHFIAGLPRSGTTLLANILAQNPKFHTTATSGIIEILFTVRNRFCELPQFTSMDEAELKATTQRILHGILQARFSNVENPVCFDKSRGWEGILETAEFALGKPPKIICPVRDVREVVASLERAYRKTSAHRQLPDEKARPILYKTVEGRCQMLLRTDTEVMGIVGTPIMAIKDAFARGWRDSIHLVEYDYLCEDPKQAMLGIYNFLEEPIFDHDFENVQQVTKENDLVWVYEDLHKIRPKVEPQEPTWPKILPKTVTDQIVDNREEGRQILPGQIAAFFWDDLLKRGTIKRDRPNPGNGNRIAERLEAARER